MQIRYSQPPNLQQYASKIHQIYSLQIKKQMLLLQGKAMSTQMEAQEMPELMGTTQKWISRQPSR